MENLRGRDRAEEVDAEPRLEVVPRDGPGVRDRDEGARVVRDEEVQDLRAVAQGSSCTAPGSLLLSTQQNGKCHCAFGPE